MHAAKGQELTKRLSLIWTPGAAQAMLTRSNTRRLALEPGVGKPFCRRGEGVCSADCKHRPPHGLSVALEQHKGRSDPTAERVTTHTWVTDTEGTHIPEVAQEAG